MGTDSQRVDLPQRVEVEHAGVDVLTLQQRSPHHHQRVLIPVVLQQRIVKGKAHLPLDLRSVFGEVLALARLGPLAIVGPQVGGLALAQFWRRREAFAHGVCDFFRFHSWHFELLTHKE